MYHAEARFYDAKYRQFMSADPIKDGLNWYAYAEANPVTFTDPTGLYAQVAIPVAAGAAAIITLGVLAIIIETSNDPAMVQSAQDAFNQISGALDSVDDYMVVATVLLTYESAKALAEAMQALNEAVAAAAAFVAENQAALMDSISFAASMLGGLLGIPLGGYFEELACDLSLQLDANLEAGLAHILEKIQNPEKNPTGYSVYVLIDTATQPIYVGITKNPTARLAAHFRNPEKVAAGLDGMSIIDTGKEWGEARILEQYYLTVLSPYLVKYHLNKINSIASSKWTDQMKNALKAMASWQSDIVENDWLVIQEGLHMW